jgi:hypothetical protein
MSCGLQAHVLVETLRWRSKGEIELSIRVNVIGCFLDTL